MRYDNFSPIPLTDESSFAVALFKSFIVKFSDFVGCCYNRNGI